MNILILTFGSRGDVQPYIALGKGLQAAGHSVTLCTAEPFESFVTENGLRYGYMSGDILKLIETDAGRGAMEDMGGLWGSIKTMVTLTKMAKPINKQMMIDSVRVAEDVQPDLVIYHPKALAAVSIAEKHGVPAVMALLQPMMAPTADFPTAGVPALPLGGGYNRLTYKLIEFGYRQYAKEVNQVRESMLGLDPFPKSAGVLNMPDGTPIPILHAFSPHLVPRPSDWPAQAHTTGYWFLDQPNNWEPSPELVAFLDAGDPPVYIGFGSMSGRNPRKTTEAVVGAVRQAGVRAIIATGWGGLDADSLPDTILKIDSAPHDWLFPQMTAVVHHGGAGTTAAGLRAGKPTVICPFFGDQPFWGSQVEKLGVGPKPVPQKKLTADKLAAAIRTAVTDQTMHAHAAALAEQIRAEDGVHTAVDLIESLLPQPARAADE